jgi:hypothetical protein
MTAPVADAVIWVKDPGDYADYEVIWTDWIRPGDSISSHTVAVQETGVEAVVVISSLVNPAGNVTVWLDGGAAGITYHLVCQVITAAGRRATRHIFVQVKPIYAVAV